VASLSLQKNVAGRSTLAPFRHSTSFSIAGNSEFNRDVFLAHWTLKHSVLSGLS